MSLEGWTARKRPHPAVAEDDDSDRTDDEDAPPSLAAGAAAGAAAPPRKTRQPAWHMKPRDEKELDAYLMGVGPKPPWYTPAPAEEDPEEGETPLHLRYSLSPEANAAREAHQRQLEKAGFTLSEGPAPPAPRRRGKEEEDREFWSIGGEITKGLAPEAKGEPPPAPPQTEAYVYGQNMSPWVERRRRGGAPS